MEEDFEHIIEPSEVVVRQTTNKNTYITKYLVRELTEDNVEYEKELQTPDAIGDFELRGFLLQTIYIDTEEPNWLEEFEKRLESDNTKKIISNFAIKRMRNVLIILNGLGLMPHKMVISKEEGIFVNLVGANFEVNITTTFDITQYEYEVMKHGKPHHRFSSTILTLINDLIRVKEILER